jgi:3',5'-cyclic AMP phosphodiesterase CpdA
LASYLIIQISDVHLTYAGTFSPGVHPRDNLFRGLRLLEASNIRPDVFLLTGDLADTAEGGRYEDLAEMLGEATSKCGATVIYLPGNHDVREEFRSHLLGAVEDGAPINKVHWRDGLRIVALDSTVPGEEYGVIGDETIEFLRGSIATPAPDGTVVALHHPPIPSPIEPMSRISLREPARLLDAIAGSDVRIVLCGHYHHEAAGTLGSIPVWVSPATAYRADVTSQMVFRGIPGAAFSRIDLTENSATATIIPIPLT